MDLRVFTLNEVGNDDFKIAPLDKFGVLIKEKSQMYGKDIYVGVFLPLATLIIYISLKELISRMSWLYQVFIILKMIIQL